MDVKDSDNQRIQNQFGAFCTRVLKNEAMHIEAEYARKKQKEQFISSLNEKDAAQLAVSDVYFRNSFVFEVQGLPVVVTGDLLAKAISNLSLQDREIILLSYFLGLSDREIGERTKSIQQTVSKRRKRILKELRAFLEKEGFSWLEEQSQ